MNKVKKSFIAAAALATVGTAGIVGVSAVNAEANTSSTDPMSSLVDKLASKFNLNKTDIQKVFDESRAEHEAQHEAEQSARLQKLVDNGTITADQKTKIEAKFKELKASREANRDSMKDLTEDERKAKMDAERTSLEAWAKENGIDLTKLQGIFMGRGPGMKGGPRDDAPIN